MKERTSDSFRKDVLKGLTSSPKFLESKYFYDARGDELFRKIMQLPEYYLTEAELEIMRTQCGEMNRIVARFNGQFDVVELGAGDAMKSRWLLECLLQDNPSITYYPTDISGNVLSIVEQELPGKIQGLRVCGITGEYFQALAEARQRSARPMLVLFLGGNIGNMPPEEARSFCTNLWKSLGPGDLALIGFDLKKNPWTIFNAYNDAEGITKRFNLNLLVRINEELNGTFDIDKFEHYESYDPESGAAKSYLVSLADQEVNIGNVLVHFRENEYVYMETSHKYDPEEIETLAGATGFIQLTALRDSQNRFTDVVWLRGEQSPES
jgi:L-histidine Nalpha-methyltransferase